MTVDDFKKYWIRYYPNGEPIAWQLRDVLKERWFRIHNLPESQRYANCEQEYQEILKRQNILLSDLLGEHQEYILLFRGTSQSLAPENLDENLLKTEARYEDSSRNIFADEHFPQLYAGSHYLKSIAMHEFAPEMFGDDAVFWNFFLLPRMWHDGIDNELLLLIADGVISNVLFISVTNKTLVIPYDGGADIFMETSVMRDCMRNQ